MPYPYRDFGFKGNAGRQAGFQCIRKWTPGSKYNFTIFLTTSWAISSISKPFSPGQELEKIIAGCEIPAFFKELDLNGQQIFRHHLQKNFISDTQNFCQYYSGCHLKDHSFANDLKSRMFSI